MVSADQTSTEVDGEVERQVVALINEGRAAPLEMAGRLGLDPGQVLEDCPELETILIGGLPPLSFDEIVSSAAHAHVEDMVRRGFYDEVNPEGEAAADRLHRAGYPAYFAGESLGLLAFLNFMDPTVAAERLFASMFRDELRPEREEPRFILGQVATDIGVGFGSRQTSVDGRTFNSYIMAVDFASRLDTSFSGKSIRRALLQLLNQARRDPRGAAVSTGVEEGELGDRFAGYADLFRDGAPPFNRNDILQSVAENHTREMVVEGVVSSLSVDGRTPAERSLQAGYPTDTWVDERIALIPADESGGFAQAAAYLFRTLLHREFEDWDRSGPVLLNPELREVGLAVGSLVLFEEGSGYRPYFVATAILGGGGFGHSPHILLTFFLDQNGDGVYAPGEGVPGFGFEVWGYDTGVFPPAEVPMGLLMTDETGGLQISAFPGVFVIRSDFGNGIEKWILNLDRENVSLPVGLGDPSDAG